METPHNPYGNDDRNQWEGREEERLSKYDESNEGNREDYSLSAAENTYNNPTPDYSMNSRESAQEDDDNSKYDNSYGMGSDSSRSLLMTGNEMVFENDHEGQ